MAYEGEKRRAAIAEDSASFSRTSQGCNFGRLDPSISCKSSLRASWRRQLYDYSLAQLLYRWQGDIPKLMYSSDLTAEIRLSVERAPGDGPAASEGH